MRLTSVAIFLFFALSSAQANCLPAYEAHIRTLLAEKHDTQEESLEDVSILRSALPPETAEAPAIDPEESDQFLEAEEYSLVAGTLKHLPHGIIYDAALTSTVLLAVQAEFPSGTVTEERVGSPGTELEFAL